MELPPTEVNPGQSAVPVGGVDGYRPMQFEIVWRETSGS